MSWVTICTCLVKAGVPTRSGSWRECCTGMGCSTREQQTHPLRVPPDPRPGPKWNRTARDFKGTFSRRCEVYFISAGESRRFRGMGAPPLLPQHRAECQCEVRVPCPRAGRAAQALSPFKFTKRRTTHSVMKLGFFVRRIWRPRVSQFSRLGCCGGRWRLL